LLALRTFCILPVNTAFYAEDEQGRRLERKADCKRRLRPECVKSFL
jgi:hypothetical protein